MWRFDPSDSEGCMKLLEDLTSNAKQVQQQVLDEILVQNAKTEYLGGFLDGHCDMQLFKEKVPIVTYEEMKPYIERIANGENSLIISSQPITEFRMSSGTSGGKPNIMPYTEEESERKIFFYHMASAFMNKYFEGMGQGKSMYLHFVKPDITTPSGLLVLSALSSSYRSNKNRPIKKFNFMTSPDETIMCLDIEQSMYCQLLCGLVQRHQVLKVGASFASALLRAIKFLAKYWTEISSNIRTGCLSEWITDSGCRNSVLLILNGPNPQLADSIEMECGGKSWEGIIKRLWPKTKYIDVIVTGSMAQYIPMLEYYGGGLPLVSPAYGCSECNLGINLNFLCKPSNISYTLVPNMAYFEFIPIDKNYDHEEEIEVGGLSDEGMVEAVGLTDVQVGRYYELVVTTFTGLYRYRVGDILMVTGFHNNAPQFRFVERKNVILSIEMDKTSEEDLFKAVAQAKLIVEPLGFLLAEYTSYADLSSVPGHYVLFWELETRSGNCITHSANDDDVIEFDTEKMEECCLMVEESLNLVYRYYRKNEQSIGPLEIRVVKQGTFDALMDFCVSKGSSVNQYKTPRCIKSVEALHILDSRVVGRYFSRKAPSWNPDLVSKRQNETTKTS